MYRGSQLLEFELNMNKTRVMYANKNKYVYIYHSQVRRCVSQLLHNGHECKQINIYIIYYIRLFMPINWTCLLCTMWILQENFGTLFFFFPDSRSPDEISRLRSAMCLLFCSYYGQLCQSFDQ